MRKKIVRKFLWVSVISGILVVVSCASQPEPSNYDPTGFFMGVFHGFTIIFSFIGSIFTDVRIYAFPNSGFMYDFGYLIGLAFWAIEGSLGR